MDCGTPPAWEELVRTASAVRATPFLDADPPQERQTAPSA